MTTFMPEIGSANELMLTVVKFMFVIAGVLYTLFSFLIVRQVSLMSKTLGTTDSTKNKSYAYAHLITSIVVLIYYLLVL